MNTKSNEKENAVEIFDIVVKEHLLPEKVSELVPLSFMGQAAVSFYRTKVKAMNQLALSEEQRKATLSDGQDAGEMLLEIEKRIGELLPSEQEIRAAVGKNQKGIPVSSRNGGSKLLPEGMTRNRIHQSRSIANNPKIVEQVKKQARENEDIPTKTAVLNRIAYEKEKKRKDKAAKDRTEMHGLIRVEQAKYLNQLDRILLILPQKPPKDWTDPAFREAKAKAKIILKRLEVFLDGGKTNEHALAHHS